MNAPQLHQTEMNFNSLDAYYNQVLPTLTKREATVLEAIKTLGKATLRDLEQYLNRGSNTFSGRLTRLKKDGIIKVLGRVKINESSFSVYQLNNVA